MAQAKLDRGFDFVSIRDSDNNLLFMAEDGDGRWFEGEKFQNENCKIENS
jgi:hypothetical protein